MIRLLCMMQNYSLVPRLLNRLNMRLEAEYTYNTRISWKRDENTDRAGLYNGKGSAPHQTLSVNITRKL